MIRTSLVLKQLGDLRVSAQVRASRMCVREAMFANWRNPVSDALSAGIYMEENRGRQQDQPHCEHTHSNGSVVLYI